MHGVESGIGKQLARLVFGEHLGHLVADGQRRVQRFARILEDHRDVITADRAHPADGRGEQVDGLLPAVVALFAPVARAGPAGCGDAAGLAALLAAGAAARRAGHLRVEHGVPAGEDARRPRHQLQQRPGGDALTRPGLADQAERLALVDVEVDPVDRVHDATLRGEVNPQVAHRKQGRLTRARRLRQAGDGALGDVHRPSLLGSRTSRRPSPNRLKPKDQRNTMRPPNVATHQRPEMIPDCP